MRSHLSIFEDTPKAKPKNLASSPPEPDLQKSVSKTIVPSKFSKTRNVSEYDNNKQVSHYTISTSSLPPINNREPSELSYSHDGFRSLMVRDGKISKQLTKIKKDETRLIGSLQGMIKKQTVMLKQVRKS